MSIWQKKQILKEKKLIKAELEAIFDPARPKKTIRFALNKISELEEDESSLGLLRRYLYGISTLYLGANYGGLNARQVRGIHQMTRAILKTQNIRPLFSRLGFLHGDLYIALSQISMREGQQWKASWEQQLSFLFSRLSPSGGSGYDLFALGLRAFRLGHASLAMRELNRAEQSHLHARYLVRSGLEKVKALRLMGLFDKAEILSQQVISSLELSTAETEEIGWERLCRQAQKTQDIFPLIQAVKRGGSHHSSAYVLEAFLWTRIVRSRELVERFARANRLANDVKIFPKEHGFLYQCVHALELAYDYQIPFHIRLENMGKVIAQMGRLPSVDYELLIWAALVRWLSRSHTHSLAVLALGEYQGLSLKLSDGKSRDVLGLLSDLFERDWAKRDQQISQQKAA